MLPGPRHRGSLSCVRSWRGFQRCGVNASNNYMLIENTVVATLQAVSRLSHNKAASSGSRSILPNNSLHPLSAKSHRSLYNMSIRFLQTDFLPSYSIKVISL